MPKQFKIDVDTSTITGYIEMLKSGDLRDYDETQWISRTSVERRDTTNNIFTYVEKVIGLPVLSVMRLKVITVHGHSMAAGMEISNIPHLEHLAQAYASGPKTFLHECKDMYMVVNLIHQDHGYRGKKVYESSDGFVGALTEHESLPFNKLGLSIVENFRRKLSPEELVKMKELRKEFLNYMQKTTGKEIPTSDGVKRWLESKGLPHKSFDDFSGGVDAYTAAGRYDLLTLSDGDFQEWLIGQGKRKATSYVVTSLLAAADIAEESVAYEAGAVAMDSVVAEIIGWLAAIILV